MSYSLFIVSFTGCWGGVQSLQSRTAGKLQCPTVCSPVKVLLVLMMTGWLVRGTDWCTHDRFRFNGHLWTLLECYNTSLSFFCWVDCEFNPPPEHVWFWCAMVTMDFWCCLYDPKHFRLQVMMMPYLVQAHHHYLQGIRTWWQDETEPALPAPVGCSPDHNCTWQLLLSVWSFEIFIKSATTKNWQSK